MFVRLLFVFVFVCCLVTLLAVSLVKVNSGVNI